MFEWSWFQPIWVNVRMIMIPASEAESEREYLCVCVFVCVCACMCACVCACVCACMQMGWHDLEDALCQKSAYLFCCFQAKEQIQKEASATAKPLLLDLLEEIHASLKSNDFHGSYFDRQATAKQRLCDKKGWFKCQGAFDRESCDKLHTINPYASRGYRQLFGLWNLDHMYGLWEVGSGDSSVIRVSDSWLKGWNRMTANVLKQNPNTKRLKSMLIYCDTDKQ